MTKGLLDDREETDKENGREFHFGLLLFVLESMRVRQG
jgi:hypothetical protein